VHLQQLINFFLVKAIVHNKYSGIGTKEEAFALLNHSLLKNHFLVRYVYSKSTTCTKFLAEINSVSNCAKLCYKLGLVLLYQC